MLLLGLGIDNLSREEVLEKVVEFLNAPGYHRIATANPEFLLLAQKNQKFHQSLEEADLRVADGAGIALGFLSKGQRLKARYPGADLVMAMLTLAENKGYSVYLAIRQDGLSTFQEIRTLLLEKFPQLKINGADLDPETSMRDPQPITGNLLLCNFGIPEQEIYLSNVKDNPGAARLAMGVGGSFDYLTGKLSRAPKFLRTLGLEWLWRLLLQPKRWKRIWNAVFVFLFKVIFDR